MVGSARLRKSIGENTIACAAAPDVTRRLSSSVDEWYRKGVSQPGFAGSDEDGDGCDDEDARSDVTPIRKYGSGQPRSAEKPLTANLLNLHEKVLRVEAESRKMGGRDDEERPRKRTPSTRPCLQTHGRWSQDGLSSKRDASDHRVTSEAAKACSLVSV